MRRHKNTWFKLVALAIALVLIVSILAACGKGEEKEIKTPTELKTYSDYGFSFEYPKTYSVSEMGLQQNEANDMSGVVQAGIENEESELFQVAWVGMIKSMWESWDNGLEDSLEGSIEGAENTEGIASLERGELVETTKAGHRMLYQYYTLTSAEGDTAYGIIGALYCDKSQRLLSFMTMNTTTSTTQDVQGYFQNYLDSFVCH